MQIDMELEIHNLEQIAYGAVLRAFKAQSDALTWEKEGLITELRKELRVSDDEHRLLLTEVNADDLILRIREWREAGGSRNVAPNGVQNQLQSPRVSAPRKRQKASLSGNTFGAQSQPLHPETVTGTMLPLASASKWRPTPGVGGLSANDGQPVFAPANQFADHVSSGAPVDDPSENERDSLVGRRVMIRWPADNNFYEALITEYNPVDEWHVDAGRSSNFPLSKKSGQHSLVYDCNTPNATLEWINIKEVPPEDIRWLGDDPVTSQLGEMSGPKTARLRLSSTNPFAKEIRPPMNEAISDDYEEIEILRTDTLIKKVEKVLDATHPDLSEIHKAKKMLKEHEQTLIQVIEKLAAVCGSGTEDIQRSDPSHEPDIPGRITGSS